MIFRESVTVATLSMSVVVSLSAITGLGVVLWRDSVTDTLFSATVLASISLLTD